MGAYVDVEVDEGRCGEEFESECRSGRVEWDKGSSELGGASLASDLWVGILKDV